MAVRVTLACGHGAIVPDHSANRFRAGDEVTATCVRCGEVELIVADAPPSRGGGLVCIHCFGQGCEICT
jgi:hypothetical protein